jgi:hypothetical protein
MQGSPVLLRVELEGLVELPLEEGDLGLVLWGWRKGERKREGSSVCRECIPMPRDASVALSSSKIHSGSWSKLMMRLVVWEEHRAGQSDRRLVEKNV